MSKSIKLNIAYPATGGQKSIQVEDEQKLRALFDKRIAMEVSGDDMGPEFKGYVFRITGGNDRQGFPMMQGVMAQKRVRLLLGKDSKCFRPRRDGMRKRKSVRGCIVNQDMSVINLVVVKKGEEELPGVTDVAIPRRHGPKRAANIRKEFNLDPEDDVRQYVLRRLVTRPEGKGTSSKAPRIMRLVTPQRRQRKRAWAAAKRKRWEKSRESAKEYATLVSKYQKELREARAHRRATRRSTRASASQA